jgi:hypothetical protein
MIENAVSREKALQSLVPVRLRRQTGLGADVIDEMELSELFESQHRKSKRSGKGLRFMQDARVDQQIACVVKQLRLHP